MFLNRLSDYLSGGITSADDHLADFVSSYRFPPEEVPWDAWSPQFGAIALLRYSGSKERRRGLGKPVLAPCGLAGACGMGEEAPEICLVPIIDTQAFSMDLFGRPRVLHMRESARRGLWELVAPGVRSTGHSGSVRNNLGENAETQPY